MDSQRSDERMRIESAGVDGVLADPDEEEALEMALVNVLPAKDVVTRPDRWRQ